jgi:hypothetical protein
VFSEKSDLLAPKELCSFGATGCKLLKTHENREWRATTASVSRPAQEICMVIKTLQGTQFVSLGTK